MADESNFDNEEFDNAFDCSECTMQSLVLQNLFTTVQYDLFLSNDRVYDTSPASNDDNISDNIENTKDEDANDACNKDEYNCSDKKNIIIRKKKKEKRKTLNTKDHNEELHNSTKHNDNKSISNNIIDHNSTATSPISRKIAFFIDDSMVKEVNGLYLAKNFKHKYLVKVG